MKKRFSFQLIIFCVSLIANIAQASEFPKGDVLIINNYDKQNESENSEQKTDEEEDNSFKLNEQDNSTILDLVIDNLKESKGQSKTSAKIKIKWKLVIQKFLELNKERTKECNIKDLKQKIQNRFNYIFALKNSKRHDEYINRRKTEGLPPILTSLNTSKKDDEPKKLIGKRDRVESEIVIEGEGYDILKKSKAKDTDIIIKGIAILIIKDLSDDLIFTAIKSCNDPSYCFYNDFIPTSLFMIERDRFELFKRFMIEKPNHCLLDKSISKYIKVSEAILESLLSKNKFDEIIYLLSQKIFSESITNKMHLCKRLILANNEPALLHVDDILIQLISSNDFFDEAIVTGDNALIDLCSLFIQNKKPNLLEKCLKQLALTNIELAKKISISLYKFLIDENPHQEDVMLLVIKLGLFDPNSDV